MFAKNSRYYDVPMVTAIDGRGRQVQAVSLSRLSATTGEAGVVHDHDQLDVMSQRRNKDCTHFWHIADANRDLEANALVKVSGRVIDVPVK